jgi:hypothetical protein
MSRKMFLAAAVGLLFAACGTSGLNPLVLDGHELHASLVTQQIDDVPLHVPRAVLRDNPQLSTDSEFVEAVARGASHGQLGGEGIRAALYAVYRGEIEIGIYGLEAASTAEADRLEGLLRGIWAKNASLDRARVHRGGEVLVVVWNDRVSTSCWEAVNAVVAERLVAP